MDIFAEEMNDTLEDSFTQCIWKQEDENVSASELRPEIYKTSYVLFVAYPILLLICTVGNSINVYILSRVQSPQSTTIYLLAISVANLFTLWSHLPSYILEVNKDLLGHSAFFSNYMYLDGIFSWIKYTFPDLSDWVLVIFALERMVEVAKPMFLYGQNAAKRARILVLLIFIWEAVINTVFLAEAYYAMTLVDHETYETYYKEFYRFGKLIPLWIDQWNEFEFYYLGIEAVSVFCCLIAAVIITRRYSIRNRKSDGQGFLTGESNINKLMYTMAAMTFAFQSPMMLAQMLNLVSAYPFCLYNYTAGEEVAPVVETLVYINYSVNFFMYIACSSNYRYQAKGFFSQIISCVTFGKTDRNGFVKEQPSTVAEDPFDDKVETNEKLIGNDGDKPATDDEPAQICSGWRKEQTNHAELLYHASQLGAPIHSHMEMHSLSEEENVHYSASTNANGHSGNPVSGSSGKADDGEQFLQTKDWTSNAFRPRPTIMSSEPQRQLV